MEVDRPLGALASYPADRTREVLRLASCAALLVDSVLPENWAPPEHVLSWVVLSPEGTELERSISRELPSAKPAEVRLGVFIAFVSSSGFLIDDGATAVRCTHRLAVGRPSCSRGQLSVALCAGASDGICLYRRPLHNRTQSGRNTSVAC
jgi:hypothetical protein